MKILPKRREVGRAGFLGVGTERRSIFDDT
jgi:hypothetical protein